MAILARYDYGGHPPNRRIEFYKEITQSIYAKIFVLMGSDRLGQLISTVSSDNIFVDITNIEQKAGAYLGKCSVTPLRLLSYLEVEERPEVLKTLSHRKIYIQEGIAGPEKVLSLTISALP